MAQIDSWAKPHHHRCTSTGTCWLVCFYSDGLAQPRPVNLSMSRSSRPCPCRRLLILCGPSSFCRCACAFSINFMQMPMQLTLGQFFHTQFVGQKVIMLDVPRNWKLETGSPRVSSYPVPPSFSFPGRHIHIDYNIQISNLQFASRLGRRCLILRPLARVLSGPLER